MKQIKHTLFQSTEPMDMEQCVRNFEQIFEWVNNAGLKGRLMSHLDIQPTVVTCVEYVTDANYAAMLKNGTIKESVQKKPDVEEQKEL